MNRRMGFLKELALAQKLICRLWGIVAANAQVNHQHQLLIRESSH
jgi:hypothetical protein